LVDKEDFKEEMNVYIVEGLHVPYDELKKLQAGDEEATTLVEIDLTSTPLDEPNITCQGSSEAKVHAEISRYYWY
jgi:hypothetical protein